MSCGTCNCNPCCCPSTTVEPLASEVDNLIAAILGSITKTNVNGEWVWTLGCDLEAGVAGFPRNAGEGTNCYLLRLFTYLNAAVGAIVVPLPVASGGTGGASASAARTNLGLAIGSDVQAHDSDLDSWSAVARAAGFDTFVATPTSANLAALITNETGSGLLVFGTAPTLVEPVLTNVNNTMQTLTDAATIAWDTDLGAIATVALGANRAMGLPTNMHPGTYILITTGAFAITSWDAIFDWGSGTAPTGGGTKNVYSFVYNGTKFTGAAVTSVA